MQRAPDLVSFQIFFQVVAAWGGGRRKMIGTLGPIRLMRQLQWRVRQQFLITMRHAAPLSVHAFEMLQLDAEHRALNAFHTVVVSDLVVVIALSRAVLAEGASPGRKRGVVCDQSPTFAVSTEVFSGIKAETRR